MLLPLFVFFLEFLMFLVGIILFIAACVVYYYNMRTRWEYSDDDFHWRFPVRDITSTTFNVLLDKHVHTTYKGGNLSIRQNIKWHLANGFNAMVLTEHNCFQPWSNIEPVIQEFAGQVVILQGMEWTTERIHMNFLDIHEWTMPIPAHPTNDDIQQAIIVAHEKGAIVVVNHPHEQARKSPDHPAFSDLATWGVDYIEIASQGFHDTEAAQLCGTEDPEKFGAIAGTDVHFPIPVNSWTAMTTASFTPDSIMGELRAKRTEVIYDEKGSPDFTTRHVPRDRQKMALFIAIGKIFCTVTRSQLALNGKIIAETLLLLTCLFWLMQACVATILLLF
jgi:hypothetical protein